MAPSFATRFNRLWPWLVLGAVAGVALANWSSRWVFLLAPVVWVAAFLVWQLNPAWEFFGLIAGLAVAPLIVGTQPLPCALDGCDHSPHIVWPFLVVAAVMLVMGGVLGTRPAPARWRGTKHRADASTSAGRLGSRGG